MKMAIIGTDHVERICGTALRSKVHTVVYGSRDPAGHTGRSVRSVAGAFVIARRQDVAKRNSELRVRLADPQPQDDAE
jgi:hypothetical protein